MHDIGQRLRDARTRAVLSQEQLGEAAGVSPITISRLETGRAGNATPRPSTVQALARALGVSPQWLMFGEMQRESQTGKWAA